MRKIVHISDVHFGKADSGVVAHLIEKITEIGPDIVVVSGDLTQRARKEQFIEARQFLDQLPTPQIVVPGNHDVPLYNIFRRFAAPLANYKKYITSEMFPFFADDEMVVLGINTARSLTIKNGRIGEEQVEIIRNKLFGLDETFAKIIVTHHPFDLPSGSDDADIVGRAGKFMPQIAECGADIFLSGHLHVSSITNSAHRYRLDSGRSALIIQAGTATSSRVRGEPNSFNLIELERPLLSVKRFECQSPANSFLLGTSEQFTQTERGWTRM